MSTLGFEDLVCRALDGDPGLALTAPHAITVRAGTVLLAGPPELLVRGSCDGSWLLLDGSPALALSAPAALVRGSELGGAAKLVVTSAGTITTRAELPRVSTTRSWAWRRHAVTRLAWFRPSARRSTHRSRSRRAGSPPTLPSSAAPRVGRGAYAPMGP